MNLKGICGGMKKTKDKTNTILCVIAFILPLLTGCSITGKQISWEPSDIVVRNSSGKNLKVVSLSEVGRDSAQSYRFGFISPAPIGLEQSVTRSAPSNKFPSAILIEWVDNFGKVQRKLVNIKEVLKTENTEDKRALVFNILPQGDISITLE